MEWRETKGKRKSGKTERRDIGGETEGKRQRRTNRAEETEKRDIG
jgi:hypothetical protein